MNTKRMTNIINAIYRNEGFEGVIDFIEGMLEYGEITKNKEDVYRITTAGFSEDERLIAALTGLLSKFRHHYLGYTVGGAYYSHPKKHTQATITTRQTPPNQMVK